MEDQGQSDEQEELDEDDQGEDEPDEEFLEAFMAAWSAKKKTTQHRLSRGFGATKGKGQGKSARPSSASVKSEKTDSSSQVDPRKAASRCADCKQLGHWKGDPECPRVKDGKTPWYEKTGGGKTDKKPPHKIHWIGAVSSRGTQEVVTPPSAEIVSLRRNVGRSASGKSVDNVELRFSSKRMVDYITDRLDRGSEIFFGSRHSGGLITEYKRLSDDNHQVLDLGLLLVVQASGEKRSAGVMMEAMWKVLGPIDKDLDSEKMILTSAEERRAKESQKEPYRGNSDQGSQAAASSKRGRSPKLMERNSKRPEREVPHEARRKVRREPRDRRDRSPEPEEEGKNLRKDKEKTQKPTSAGLRKARPGGWSEALLRGEDIERYPEEVLVGQEVQASSSSEYESSGD